MMLAAALLSAAAACTKEGPGTDPLDGVPISISATAPETKAMLDADAFKQDGNRIIIYDFVDNATDPYFSDLIGPDVVGSDYANSQKSDGVWPFVNGPHQWTPGTHNFFGWLVKDVNKTAETTDDLTPVSLFGNTFATVDPTDDEPNVTVAAFDNSTRTLTIPATTMSPTSPQFDFMYSNIYNTEPVNQPVELFFDHLFTAVSFGIENSSASSATIKSFSVEDLYTGKSAIIKFDLENGSADANYTSESTTDYITFTSELTLAAGGKTNFVHNGSAWTTSDTRQYYLMWPQIKSEVHSQNEITYTGTGNNITTIYPTDWKINLTYTQNNQTKTIRLNLPNIDWEAGQRYHFNILFAATVQLYYEVVDWDKVSNTVTFN